MFYIASQRLLVHIYLYYYILDNTFCNFFLLQVFLIAHIFLNCVLDVFMKHGYDPNNNGQTPLHLVVSRGCEVKLDLLFSFVDKGADPTLLDSELVKNY